MNGLSRRPLPIRTSITVLCAGNPRLCSEFKRLEYADIDVKKLPFSILPGIHITLRGLLQKVARLNLFAQYSASLWLKTTAREVGLFVLSAAILQYNSKLLFHTVCISGVRGFPCFASTIKSILHGISCPLSIIRKCAPIPFQLCCPVPVCFCVCLEGFRPLLATPCHNLNECLISGDSRYCIETLFATFAQCSNHFLLASMVRISNFVVGEFLILLIFTSY